MGVKGLLPLVSDAFRTVSLRDFRNRIVGVDALGVLYRASYGCAEELASGERTSFYVDYLVKYISAILSCGIRRVIVVFDGASLPAKQTKSAERRKRRARLREKGNVLLQEERFDEALTFFKQSVEVTKTMIAETMLACRKLERVDCIVAPYEADAQLAFFSLKCIVDLVITEDSDLIVFGCKQILYKFDRERCEGQLYERSKLAACFADTANFAFENFRRMCIFAGCDYCASLPGVGIAKARSVFANATNDSLKILVRKAIDFLKVPGGSEEYFEEFVKAENTFRYQLVFDVDKCERQPLLPYPPGLSCADFPYCGEMLTPFTAYQLALGNLNPHTHERLANFSPHVRTAANGSTCAWSDASSIWHSCVPPADADIEPHLPNHSTAVRKDLISNHTSEEDNRDSSVVSRAHSSTALAASTRSAASGRRRKRQRPLRRRPPSRIVLIDDARENGTAEEQLLQTDVVSHSAIALTCPTDVIDTSEDGRKAISAWLKDPSRSPSAEHVPEADACGVVPVFSRSARDEISMWLRSNGRRTRVLSDAVCTRRIDVKFVRAFRCVQMAHAVANPLRSRAAQPISAEMKEALNYVLRCMHTGDERASV